MGRDATKHHSGPRDRAWPRPADTDRGARVSVTTARVAAVLTLLLVVAGVALRSWRFAAGLSIAGDELAVAQNVVDRSLISLLTQPLAYDQVAPRGFLLVERLAVLALGPNEYALRLFPFVASVVGLAPEVALRDEHWEVAVLGAGRLDALVDLRLHPLPDRVAVRPDDHGSARRTVLGQLRLGQDVLVPAWEVLGLRREDGSLGHGRR